MKINFKESMMAYDDGIPKFVYKIFMGRKSSNGNAERKMNGLQESRYVLFQS
jgi:hypothetical protein